MSKVARWLARRREMDLAAGLSLGASSLYQALLLLPLRQMVSIVRSHFASNEPRGQISNQSVLTGVKASTLRPANATPHDCRQDRRPRKTMRLTNDEPSYRASKVHDIRVET